MHRDPVFVVVLPILFAAATARAEPPADGIPERRPTSAFAVSLGPTMSWPRASRLAFGPVSATGARRTGDELGLGAPTLAGGELSVFYVRRYVSLAVSGSAEGQIGASGDVQSQPLVERGGGSLAVVGGGFELAATLPIERVRVSLGARTGVAAYAIPTTTLVTTCGTFRSSDAHACAANAWSPAYAVLEPRVRVSVPVLDAALWIDASAGYDLVTGGPSVGLAIRLQMPLGANASFRLAP